MKCFDQFNASLLKKNMPDFLMIAYIIFICNTIY